METRARRLRIANIEESDLFSLIKIDERSFHEPSLLPIPVFAAKRNMGHSERTCRSDPEGVQQMTNVLFDLISRLVARLGADDRGEVSIEYVLIGGMMAAAIVAGIVTLTGGLGGWFGEIATDLNNAF
jgi:Flp pilus assembly pilin Flp